MNDTDDEAGPAAQGSDSRRARRARTWRSLNRLEAFSDGVFAIVTTILIFNLKRIWLDTFIFMLGHVHVAVMVMESWL